VLVKRQPPDGRKLLVVGTTSRGEEAALGVAWALRICSWVLWWCCAALTESVCCDSSTDGSNMLNLCMELQEGSQHLTQ